MDKQAILSAKVHWNWKTISFRLLVSLFSMGAIVGTFYMTGTIWWAWTISLVVMGVLYLLSAVAPKLMEILVSNPYAFQVRHNMGPESLEFQAVTYDAYHTNWYSRLSHEAGWLFESVGWLLVMYTWLGNVGVVLTLGVVWIQVYSFGEHPMSMHLVGVWLGLTAVAYGLLALLGVTAAYTVAVYTIVSFSTWRFLGHSIGPVPAGIVDDKFHRYVWQTIPNIRVAFPMMFGYFAEFASGLPFRLTNVWLYMVLQDWLGYKPNRTISRTEIRDFSDGILDQGWTAHPVSEKIFLEASS